MPSAARARGGGRGAFSTVVGDVAALATVRYVITLDAAGQPNVVEVNPLPGILPNPADNSCFPKAARAAGISYNELIQSCLRHAARRQGVALDESPTQDWTVAMRSPLTATTGSMNWW